MRRYQQKLAFSEGALNSSGYCYELSKADTTPKGIGGYMQGRYDIIIIGAGLYGLYSAIFSANLGKTVLLLEKEDDACTRATYINQARIHMGYHYPRSISTAVKSRDYFERFVDDYSFCISGDFNQVYATSSRLSYTDKDSFIKFCNDAKIPCDIVDPGRYFNNGLCDGAYLTKEYAYDALLLKQYLLEDVAKKKDITLKFKEDVVKIEGSNDSYIVTSGQGNTYMSSFVLNTTYASCNEIIGLIGYEPIKVKYELCEIILCDVGDGLKDLGITVMDGPFFSIMPFGKTKLHSLTSVTFTPHLVSYNHLPVFDCQKYSDGSCSPNHLSNCNYCIAKPKTAYPYMSSLAKKYLLSSYSFNYKESLFSIKPIMMASEVDDSRPTVVRVHSQSPTFVSVLSGKINTVYDLDSVLRGEFE